LESSWLLLKNLPSLKNGQWFHCQVPQPQFHPLLQALFFVGHCQPQRARRGLWQKLPQTELTEIQLSPPVERSDHSLLKLDDSTDFKTGLSKSERTRKITKSTRIDPTITRRRGEKSCKYKMNSPRIAERRRRRPWVLQDHIRQCGGTEDGQWRKPGKHRSYNFEDVR
jgi:hypothetical protein